ncbi:MULTISPECIES: hypothetical protein [unclassified Pseudomonas]|uniref:hypothetical protein n=1 Tax=unclassified Pseudomonas TaxID=196821 RepID=UPI00111C368A|nr:MULTISPECIES: hypothetical protein [unclassified Pseudomonas]MDI2145467.1 hypothetical protein [Pseudomonas sp. ITA]
MDKLFAVVATTGYLLLVDLHSRKVTPIESDRPEYYGVTWFPEGKDLVLSHSGLDNLKLVDIQTYANSEVGFLSRGSFHSEPFLSQPHQILCASDGRIICTNTGRNAISVVDLEKPGHFQEKRLTSVRWDRLSLQEITGDHLNSVFEKDGHLYVIAHGHHNGSLLAVLTYPELELVSLDPIDQRTGLHNVWVSDEGQKIACHSSIGSLVDLDTNDVIWHAGSSIYARGLAVSSDVVLVGESQMTGRESRRSSMSGLWVLERDTYKPLDYLCLGPYGAVNEVRLLNARDFAHHGHVFAGTPELLEKDLFRRNAEERLANFHISYKNQKAWVAWESVFGSHKQLETGEKIAAPDSLCLLKQREVSDGPERSMSFGYSIDPALPDSHVAAVVYQGTGDDTDMNALVIQPHKADGARLVMWTHDGTQWAPEADISVTGLPFSGDLNVVASERGLELYLNKELLISVDPSKLPYLNGSLGVRWIGSTINRFSE